MRTPICRRVLVLMAAIAALTIQNSRAYTFLSYQWAATAASAGITMHLQLGGIGGGTLDDGATSWGQVAESAMAEWNSRLANFKFLVVRDSTIAKKANDGKNSVFFSSTVFGDSFGSTTLAITTAWYSSGKRTEADMVFNTAKSWNSYRGNQWGGGVYDFRRVAIHEFGHALGLGHPDEKGQSVSAIMNSIVSNIDQLQADDIAGGQALWAQPRPNITFYKPTGWADKVVLSKTPGTNTNDTGFTDKDQFYLDFAPVNSGTAETGGGWTDTIYLDGVVRASRVRSGSLAKNTYITREDVDLGPITPGTHVVKVVLDSGNDVVESNGGDNSFEKTFTVTAAPRPNLAFTKPAGWGGKVIVANAPGLKTDSATLYSSDDVYVSFAPLNNGKTTVSTPWTATLTLNDIYLTEQSTSAQIKVNAYSSNFTDIAVGKIAPGVYTLRVALDSNNDIDETYEDDSDNAFERTVIVVAPSNNALLSSLTPGTGNLSPAFAANTIAYTINVPYPVTTIALTPAAAESHAKIKVNGNAVISGKSTGNMSLSVGSNPFSTVVTAQDGSTTKTYAVTVNRSPPAPLMIVEQPQGASLTNNTSTIHLPAADVGATSSVTFTLRNVGTADLTGLVLSAIGGNSGDFTPGGLSSTTLAPGASLTFQVSATPHGLGLRSSTLRIASNDATQNPFNVPLDVLGTTHVAFATDGPTLIGESQSAEIDIVRTGSTTGAVSVRVNAVPITAKADDYEPISNLLVSFASGETVRHVTVTIKPDALNEPNETFKLVLSDPQNGAAVDAHAETLIRIIDSNDSKLPTVTITTPAANANFAESAMVVVTGKAADDKGVAKVQVSLNGGPYQDAATAAAANGLTASFSTNPLTPIPGVNKIDVKSFDTRGNESKVVTRNFNYRVKRALIAQVDGAGTLPAPFPGTDSTKEVGYAYTLTAKPAGGQVFDGWTINATPGTGITPDSALLPKLTFTHREGLILTAHFISNPFTPAITGKYDGLVTPSPDLPTPGATPTSNETCGFITTAVTGTGAFTGTLKIDGLSLPFKGVFDNGGAAHFGAAFATSLPLRRTGKPALNLSLNLDMSGASGQILGAVSSNGKVSDVQANRACYSTANKAPVQIAGLTSRPYTLLFTHQTPQPGLTNDAFPQGDGYAVGAVKTDGTVSFAGKLADDTAITVSAPLSKANAWPLFAQLYAAKKGCVAGWCTVDTLPPQSDMQSAGLLWIRPPAQTHWYPSGWPSGIMLPLIASRYNGPPASVFPGLPAPSPSGNAALTFTEGLLSGAITKDINISPANAASKASATDKSFTVTLNAGTGLINGTFILPSGAKHTFNGVLYQKNLSLPANGYFMSAAPHIPDGTGQSGTMNLHAK